MRSRLIVVLLVLTVGLAGVAAFVLTKFDGPPDNSAVNLVPPDALFYSSLYIKPSTDQKKNLRDLFERFPKAPSFEESRDDLLEQLDPFLAEAGLTYKDDVEPWLGAQAAVFASEIDSQGEPSDIGILLETTDSEATEETLLKLIESEDPSISFETVRHEGVTFQVEADPDEGMPPGAFAFLDDFLVVGTEGGVRSSIEAGTGDALANAGDYLAATASLEEDRLAELYVSVDAFIEAFESSRSAPPEAEEVIQQIREFGLDVSVGVGISAQPDAAVLEVSIGLPESGFYRDLAESITEGSLLPDLPAESVMAYGIPNLGEVVTASLDVAEESAPGEVQRGEAEIESELGLDLREDVFSWMGDAAIFLQGTGVQDLGGGLIVESDDGSKTIDFVNRLLTLANEEAPGVAQPSKNGDLLGFAVQPPGVPAPINVLGGDRLVVAYGQRSTDEAVAADPTLGGAEGFRRAEDSLGDGYSALLYADLGSVRKLAEGFLFFSGADSSAYEDEIKPWIEPLSYAISGLRLDGDTLMQRFVIGVE